MSAGVAITGIGCASVLVYILVHVVLTTMVFSVRAGLHPSRMVPESRRVAG